MWSVILSFTQSVHHWSLDFDLDPTTTWCADSMNAENFWLWTIGICVTSNEFCRVDVLICCMICFVLYRKDLCTVRTTVHQDTMMDVTGQCGSCHCLEPLILLKCWRSLLKLKLLTQNHSSESLDLTMFVKCSALVSLHTHQQPTKLDICITLYYYFVCTWPL